MSRNQELPIKTCPRCGTKAIFITDSWFGLPTVWHGGQTKHFTECVANIDTLSFDHFKRQFAMLQAKNRRLQAEVEWLQVELTESHRPENMIIFA